MKSSAKMNTALLAAVGTGDVVETGVIEPPPCDGSKGSRPEKIRTCFGDAFGLGVGDKEGTGETVGPTSGPGLWADFFVALGGRKNAAAATATTTPKMMRARRLRGDVAMTLTSWSGRGSRTRSRSHRLRSARDRARAGARVRGEEVRRDVHRQLRRTAGARSERDADHLRDAGKGLQQVQILVHGEEPA